MLAESEAAEVEEVALPAEVDEGVEVSGEDWPDGTLGEPAGEAVVGAEDVEEASAGLGVADCEVVESAGVEGVLDAGVDVDVSAGCDCCGGMELLPAPARVFIWPGRYRPAAKRTATTMKAPRAM